MINPKIIQLDGEQTGPEGCLSFPEIFVRLKRAMEITATFTDLNNKKQTIHAKSLLTRAIQHETDHLKGVLLIDHMSSVQKVAIAGKLKRLKKTQTER